MPSNTSNWMGTEKFTQLGNSIIDQLTLNQNWFVDTFNAANSGFLDTVVNLETYISANIKPLGNQIVQLPNPERQPPKTVQPDICYVETYIIRNVL